VERFGRLTKTSMLRCDNRSSQVSQIETGWSHVSAISAKVKFRTPRKLLSGGSWATRPHRLQGKCPAMPRSAPPNSSSATGRTASHGARTG